MARKVTKASAPQKPLFDGFQNAEHFYRADLQALNGSGITGTVFLAYDEDTGRLTFRVQAYGLEPNQIHIQHIHGFGDGRDATLPTLADDDADGDGYLELAEGVPDYGPILLNLTVDHASGAGGDNGHSHGALEGFPTAPNGLIVFTQTYQLPRDALQSGDDLDLNHIVIHGLSVPDGAGAGTGGEVDGTGGYKLVLPAAIAEIEAITRAEALAGLIDQRQEARAFAKAEARMNAMDDAGPAWARVDSSDWHLA